MIKVESLYQTYKVGSDLVKVLDDISFEVPDGDMLCIIGKNGSGKTTLLRLLGLMDHPTSGRITLDGQNVGSLSEKERTRLRLDKVGYIFQEQSLLGELTAYENVCLVAMAQGRPHYRERALALLDMVGMSDRLKHRPHQLSGGQQQRVAIARALMKGTKLILADEITSHLDPAGAASVMDVLKKLNTEHGITVVYVTNDTAEEIYAKHAIFLQAGKILVSSAMGMDVK